MQWLTCGAIIVLFSIAYCDYTCVCNYDPEKSVMLTPSSQGNILGYMYEYDCKPQEGQSGNDQWIAVAFEHKLGYLEKDPSLQIQTCPGVLPDEDKLPLTTKPTEITTRQTTTNLTAARSTLRPVTITKPTIMSSSKPTAVTISQGFPATEITQRSTTLPKTVTTQSTTSPTTVFTQSTTFPTTVVTQSTTSPTTVTTQPTTLPTTVTTQSTTLPTTVTTQSTTFPTTVTTQSTTLPTTVTTQSSTTTLQGHLELCPSRIQHLAKQSGELIVQFGQKCYEVVQASVAWSHAEINCNQNGGHLVQIANQQEQDFIYSFLVKHHSHSVWLGLHDRSQEENFEWISGDPVTYTNWKAGRKSNWHHNAEDCVYMTLQNGQWDDIQCGGDNVISEIFQGHHHAYVCQYATVKLPDSDGNLNMCPYRLHQQAERDRGVLGQYGHSCYELILNAQIDWKLAESRCKSRGGHLAYINNAQEQRFLLGFLNRYANNHAVWIGLTDLNSEGHFHWSSGSQVQYTNWIPGHISNHASQDQEDCTVFIPSKSGQWDDIPCGHTIHFFFFGTSSSGETHPLLCQYRTVAQPAVVG